MHDQVIFSRRLRGVVPDKQSIGHEVKAEQRWLTILLLHTFLNYVTTSVSEHL